MLSRYGLDNQNNSILFMGPLDDNLKDPNSYTAAQAWSIFSNDLSGSSVPATMIYSAEIKDE